MQLFLVNLTFLYTIFALAVKVSSEITFFTNVGLYLRQDNIRVRSLSKYYVFGPGFYLSQATIRVRL